MTRKPASKGRLVLEGPATVRNAEAIHGQLAEQLQHHKNIEIDCAGIAEADLSLVQLLLAARKSAARAGGKLVLAAPASGALRDALARGGFLPVAAGLATAEQAFWLNDGEV